MRPIFGRLISSRGRHAPGAADRAAAMPPPAPPPAAGAMDADRQMTVLGIALSREGRHDEALRLLAEVAKRFPWDAAVQADLAMALLGAGQLEDAIWGFSEALRLDPRSAQARCGLGLAYQRLERWQEAAEAFRLTESLAPDQPVGPFNLGLALQALGEHEDARRALLRAATIAPEDGEIRDALESLLSQPTAAEPPPAFTRFGGDLGSFGLPEVLEFMRVQQKTGSLVISSRQGAGILRLVQGRLTSASAPGVQRLGEMLVGRGIVRRADLDIALASQRADAEHTSEALGSLLLRARPGDHDLLSQAVLDQILDGLAEMLTWREGAFSFHPGAPTEIPSISFDTQSVVMELMSTFEERTSRSSSTPEEDR